MRVIAGELKGRRLEAPDTSGTRPVTDRVKEAVFSSLARRVMGARVLDLYAGAGSFGIEAISRGASSAVFVETGTRALGALRRNLAALGIDPDRAQVVREPVEAYVAEGVEPVDLVFCDPPWELRSTDLAAVLDAVAQSLSEVGVVVVSRRAADEVPRPARLAIDHERRYGDTRIIRYMRTQS